MQTDEFYQERKADWEHLTRLLDRARKGGSPLSTEEIQTLGRLYRRATADLALAQRDFPRNQLTQYLNQLVARAHAVIYRGEPMAYRRLWRFVTHGYPRAFRQAFPFILVAFLVFVLPALLSALILAWQPGAARILLPVGVHDLIQTIEEKELWTNIAINERPFASSFIMVNNIRVAFLAFSSGVLGGVLTFWVMLNNGLILGGLTGLTIHYGIGFELWTFVIGHGVVELSVIFIAGGAGLMLGWAVIRPGLLRRRDALALAAQRAVRLIVGCVPLLVFAGLVEGFISPAENIHWMVKWGVGLVSGTLLYAYLFLGGRNKGQEEFPRRS